MMAKRQGGLVEGLRQSPRARRIYNRLLCCWHRSNLTKLADLHGSDKWGQHRYTPHYQRQFERFRGKAVRLLEIGVGGYHDPRAGGASLRMWKDFFPRAEIFAIDLYDKRPLQEARIRIFQGSQDEPEFLAEVVAAMGRVDLVIDDGSHRCEHVQASFEFLFPHLSEGGLYVVEDTQTSYWPRAGGDSENLSNPQATIPFFLERVHGLHHREILSSAYTPTCWDETIAGLHFYPNLIFVEKGKNLEQSIYTEHARVRNESRV